MTLLYVSGLLGLFIVAVIRFVKKLGKSEEKIETLEVNNDIREKRDEIASRAPDNASNIIKRMRSEDFKF